MEIPSSLSDEELEARDAELLRRIFTPTERVTHIGHAVPSAKLIARYQAELRDIDAAHGAWAKDPNINELIN